jgi:hypothetical protein
MAGFGALVCIFAVPLLGGMFMILAGFIVVVRQATGWVHTGTWSPLEFRLAWRAIGGTEPDLPDLRGIQKILVWFLDQPLSVSLAVYGAVLFVAGLTVVLWHEGVAPGPDRARGPER